jgi:serine phosphatase RsbU (regulator of sigma subunit)
MDTEQKYIKVLIDLNTEKAEKALLQEELEQVKIQFEELELTNNNLIAATWRERDLKKKLTSTIGELNKTQIIVETQNKRITESINYSRRIQLAINPGEEDLKACIPESFMLYLPKDLISGDFPWLYRNGDYIYIAAVDCTGHGVPGAMMSMIGNLLLNDIVNNEHTMMPSEILNHLHHAVVRTLKQNVPNGNSNDGMDVGLCRINLKNKEIIYSGAHRPLFLHRNGLIEIHSGDKFPIGGMHYKGLNTFSDKAIEFKKDDAVFLFTDGFPDQTGGTEGKKLMTRNFKQFLETTTMESMDDVKTKLHDFYLEWKGETKQIDDILIIGIKF